jgi:hypothetical protein
MTGMPVVEQVGQRRLRRVMQFPMAEYRLT